MAETNNIHTYIAMLTRVRDQIDALISWLQENENVGTSMPFLFATKRFEWGIEKMIEGVNHVTEGLNDMIKKHPDADDTVGETVPTFRTMWGRIFDEHEYDDVESGD